MRYTLIFPICLLFVLNSYSQDNVIDFKPNIWLKEGIINKTLSSDHQAENKVNLRTSNTVSSSQLINFNSTNVFNKEKEALEIPYPIDNIANFTFIGVFQSTNPSKEQIIWSSQNSHKKILVTTNQVSGPVKNVPYEGGQTTIPVINSIVQSWADSPKRSMDAYFSLGGIKNNNVNSFEGLIPEYLVYNKGLDEKKRLVMETYLAIKYGITLPSADYRNSAGEAIWNNETNKEFSNHIAGIGKDDLLQLHQKQSHSTAEPPLLVIGANKITTSNNDNNYTINNRDFLIWGDNNQPFLLDEIQGNSAQTFTFLQRKWLMNSTGKTANTIPTEVKIDVTDLKIPDGFQPWLVIDRSASGNFDIEQAEFIPFSNQTPENIISFSSIFWDTDQSGQDQFTLAIRPIEPLVIQDFRLAPNPSKGELNIHLDLKEAVDVSLSIYDTHGRKIQTEQNGTGQKNYFFQINISNPGVYLIKIETPRETISKEIIITE